LYKLLSETTVDALPSPKKDIIFVDVNDPVVNGFQKLLDNKILSAPVYDPKEAKYIGFLDIRDLTSFCVFIHDSNMQADNLLDIVNFGAKMFKHATDGVTTSYLARRNPFHAVKQGSPLLEVVEILSKGTRRVPIVNGSNHVVNIISQSSIILFLQEHLKSLSPIGDAKLEELQIGGSPVLSAHKETPAIDVFRMMDSHMRSGVAVVDGDGVLCGNTSGADLKLFIQTPSVSVLQLPIMQFLNKIRSTSVDITAPVISCHQHDQLSLLIGKMAATRVHRVFVVSDAYKPVRVVSIVDILKYVVEQVRPFRQH